MTYVLLAVASFVHIGLKACMQTHVNGLHFRAVPPTSAGLAIAEVFVISSLAQEGLGLACLSLCLGGTAGTWSAMWLEKRRRARMKEGVA